MPITQAGMGRKPSGGRYKASRMKRIFELAGRPTHTTIGEAKKKQDRTRAGKLKTRLLKTDVVNVVGKDGKCQQAKIKTVTGNTADPQFVRRNIMNKGAVVDTDIGKVRITNRPGQEGTLNGVLL